MLESIEKLREWSHRDDFRWLTEDGEKIVMTTSSCAVPVDGVNVGQALRDLADEIEQEITEKYMPLPLDADMSELLPCPFCGGEARLSGETFENTICSWVYCTSCGSAGGYRRTEAEAIAAWNTRSDYHGYEQAAIEAWKSIKIWNTRAERTCNNCGAKEVRNERQPNE